MKEKKNIFDYLGQVFCIFGITIAIVAVFCLLFGKDAKGVSAMFSLGNEGLSVITIGQFLAVSFICVGLRFLFFSDILFKTKSLLKRILFMLISVVAVIGGFIYFCDWFPVDVWQAWLMFFLCFGICFVISTLVAAWKERMENRRMEEGLKRIKDKLEDTCT